ncbi:MAG: UDP-N-acetylglucosamine 1-carboxyvinyltransferase [Oscillospiraceae bacterium]|jgi:UDP-N-acetylglucosamine 1-carboxyvinyltransferase|nr:UDP-N-acetylglucosamine 1-carboxyvinyltransferase [Oscillospiraceae bacterium]
MAELTVTGGRRLMGEITVQGAKNSALPLLAATFCIPAKCTLQNMPALSDVSATLSILRHLGCTARREGQSITIDATTPARYIIPESLMRELRSSIFLLGPLLARFGRAEIFAPGGCNIGARPIDLHLAAMKQMGATIRQTDEKIILRVPRGLHGADINLRFPSVGATENIIMAAAIARGTTQLHGAAREPEIVDLADFLNRCGAKISGAGKSDIVIEGVRRLHGCTYQVMPDRIIASSCLSAAALTGGEILLRGVNHAHLAPVLPAFRRMGCRVTAVNDALHLYAPRRLVPFGALVTAPYPGFPTDSQSAFLAMACTASGVSRIKETIFESRFHQAREFAKMGAHIAIRGSQAEIYGVPRLHGARVKAMDLRGGAALAVAALGAHGQTTVTCAELIDRGWEDIAGTLRRIGANIAPS